MSLKIDLLEYIKTLSNKDIALLKTGIDAEVKKRQSVKVNNNEPLLIKELDMSVRLYNILKGEGINDLKQIEQFKEADCVRFRNSGKKTIEELKLLMFTYNLSFKSE